MIPYLLLIALSLVIGYAFTRWLIDDERRIASNPQTADPQAGDDAEPAHGRLYLILRTILPTLAFGLLAGMTLCALLWSSGMAERFGG